MAIDPSIAGLAARKYQIQQQQADSVQRLQQSQAGLTDVQAGLAPGEAAARNYATRSQGTAALGQANLANTTAQLAPQQLSSEDTLRRGQAGFYGAEANRANTEASLAPQQFGLDFLRSQQQHDQTNPFTTNLYAPGLQGWQGDSGSIFHNAPATPVGPAPPTGLVSYLPTSVQNWLRPGSNGNLIGGNPLGQNAYHAAEGMNKVPGKGDGKTDTQPAMLAPGEAVLNRGAAEHLGRDTISLLNAIGARRMGLTIGDDSDKSTPNKGSNAGVDNQTGAPAGSGYAEGTPYVDPGLSAATSSGAGYARGTSNIAAGDSWPMQGSPGPDGRAPMPGYNYGTPYTGSAPGPGQTITSGSWDPAEAAAQAKANSAAPAPMQPAPAPGFGKRLVPPKVPAMARGSSNVSAEKGTKPMKSAPKGEAKGKPKMSPHAAAHTPTGANLPPGILEALLSMGGQGGAPQGAGGIPGPGGPPPMPASMPMPQVARR